MTAPLVRPLRCEQVGWAGARDECSMNDYEAFIEAKSQAGDDAGFDPLWMPDCLHAFQKALTGWTLKKGRAACFADCGLGKTPMQLTWAENVARKTGKRVLILTPLAVGHQTEREGRKFGIDAKRWSGRDPHRITILNYERITSVNPSEFVGVVCDESSILKSFDGVRRLQVTEFLRTMPYRLLCTATAAPNDYVELGTSSEALGQLGYHDMLERFFVNDQHTSAAFKGRWRGGEKFRFKGHAETPFWKWVCSWARACRKPSDLGFADAGFALPDLAERDHVVKAHKLADGMLLPMAAHGLSEEREELRRTTKERCEKAAELVSHSERAVVWCNLNEEGRLLARLIDGSLEVSGADSDDAKQDKLVEFTEGRARVLVTKPKIGAWGLNWQHCAHVVYFPSHSYEQYYQAVRRCWRYGQTKPVVVDFVASEGQAGIRRNLARKAEAASRMFTELVRHMGDALGIKRSSFAKTTEVPEWLSTISA